MLEVALTLPAICALIFFAIELMKIHIVQTTLEVICAEATFSTICGKANMEYDAIIVKYLPKFIPRSAVRYYFHAYVSLETMCAASPYGGESVVWSDRDAIAWTEVGDTGEFLKTGTENTRIDAVGERNEWTMATTYLKSPWTSANPLVPIPSGYAFVITFVCKYPFSSAFVKRLFGSNTTINDGSGRKGTSYLFWARGVGVIN
jgi:hypothetical protein